MRSAHESGQVRARISRPTLRIMGAFEMRPTGVGLMSLEVDCDAEFVFACVRPDPESVRLGGFDAEPVKVAQI